MSYSPTSFKIGPGTTPNAIKNIIFITCGVSLLTALLTNFFNDQLGISGPEQWFSLSWWGMSNYLWWQPVSFLFVQGSDQQGITLGFLIHLLFNMGILWIMGSEVYDRVGKSPFLKFYFITGVLTGLITFLLMPITSHYGVISGATPSILALLVAWTLIHPDNELLLFFLLPIKAKWLVLGIIGTILLTSLSSWSMVSFNLCFFGVLTGYLYGLIEWDLHSPFVFMYRFELATIRFAEKIRQTIFRLLNRISPLPQKERKNKVLDIKTGKTPLDDEAFTQAMLRKMAKEGLNSLTWQERERMKKLSEKKAK